MPDQARIGRTISDSTPAFGRPRRPREGSPNVVLILLDDLGFADFGCYGSTIATPHIDRLAAGGLRYNNFHATAICSPTRACIMTGRNHHRVGIGLFPDIPLGFPGYTGRIPRSAGTLPRVLRDAGYSTFAAGKWHLTPRDDRAPAGPFDLWPLGIGFERFYGFLGGMTDQYSPDLVSDNGFVDWPAPYGDDVHLTEDLASKSIRFLQEQKQSAPDKPFFLHLAPGAMHMPHQVPARWIEPYRGRFDDGWETYRSDIFRSQVSSGIVPSGTKLTERPHWVRDWRELRADERRLFARQMEVYAGMLTHTDAQIGRVLDFLTEIGELDNTIVMVMSDNGASSEGGPIGQLFTDATDLEGMLARFDDLGGPDVHNHYAWGWTWAGNTPFKLWKRYSWLGGVRVPFVVHWPDGLPRDAAGSVRTQFGHAIDLMPTILEAAGVPAPDVIDGISQLPLDGASLLDTFVDAGAPSPRDTQYFEAIGSRAIYHDGWKATTDHIDATMPHERDLVGGSTDFEDDRWSLYRVSDDFCEAQDLASSEPQQLRRMVDLWWREAGRNDVLPLVPGLGADALIAADVPPVYPVRDEYVYRPGGGAIVTPGFANGFRVVADVEVHAGEPAAGVICSHHAVNFGGTAPDGWACYVAGGRLIVAFKSFGPTERVACDAPTAGRHEIEVTYTPGAPTSTLTVAVDGTITADHTFAARKRPWPYGQGKLLIGRDGGIPVSGEYRPPFAFTGQVHSVRFASRPPAGLPDADEAIAAARQYE